jgi:serpin B
LVIVPDARTFNKFERKLGTQLVETIIANLKPRMVDLTFPKFSFESSFDLAAVLSSMGMPDAFILERADFSGMDGTYDLYIKDVFHKAFVAVNEQGTEAAAASAVVAEEKSLIMDVVKIIVDRPFIFIIRDKESGSLLFVGRVLNPLQ